MKSMIKLPAIVLGLLLMFTGATQKVMAQGDDVSLQSFYDELSPYGTWIQDPQYGYVWRPDVEQDDFRPYYTNGRWVMTEYGNTWVSNYDWGWAPFHYGRWVYNRFNQWIWLPDTTWGPAWVSWRSGGGYYGWAPMGPGMNININFNIPSLWWVFVPQRNIYYDSFPRYYSRRNTVIINNTTIINNTYVNNRRTYYTGPRADDIRRSTGRDVRVYNVNTSARPSRSNISGNNVNIYTPRPSRGNNNVNAAPRESIRGEGYTTIRERGERVGERGTRNTNNNSGTARPSRTELQGTREDNPNGRTNNRENGVPTPSTRGERPSAENTDRPSRMGSRESSVQNQQQVQERQQAQERMQQQRQQVQERQQTQERQQRQERAQQQQNAENQRQQYERSQRQSQERRPQQQAQPQYQRPERVQQSAPSRGNSGSGGRSESSRPSRGGRG